MGFAVSGERRDRDTDCGTKEANNADVHQRMFVQVDYNTIPQTLRRAARAAALHPYLRLFVLLLTFLSLFSAVVVTNDNLPPLKSPDGGPSGDRAWRDLQRVTVQPRPFNSRQNDVVRSFILEEMEKGTLCFWTYLRIVAANYSDVIVEDDRVSMVLDDRMDLITRLSGDTSGIVTYFEGLNILVRIPGTRQITGAILVSAHFDSVSTARGATVFFMCCAC